MGVARLAPIYDALYLTITVSLRSKNLAKYMIHAFGPEQQSSTRKERHIPTAKTQG
jgi:hypothetical protein